MSGLGKASAGPFAAGALVVTMMLALSPLEARACSCARVATAREAFAASAVVFRGRVVSVRRDGARLKARISVEQRWKGAPGDAVEIDNDTMCGFEFVQGTSVIVYAAQAEEPLSVSICSRTRLVEQAAEDLAVLDAATVDAPAPVPRVTPGAADAVAPSAPVVVEPPQSQPAPLAAPSTVGCSVVAPRRAPDVMSAWAVLACVAVTGLRRMGARERWRLRASVKR